LEDSMEDSMRAFGRRIDDLIGGKNLSREEAREMFCQVLLDEQSQTQQGAFLAAITAKGATPEEIAGGWEAIYDLDTTKIFPVVSGVLVDNCGTGMDTLQTFNISTAASIVAAAAGVSMAKHGARAITSRCGTVDILETLGVDVECDVSTVQKSIENAGIGIFNGMSSKVHPEGLGRILSKVRFGTILNISASLANPASPRYAVRGVYSKDMVVPIAEAMRQIGYLRAMVVHGLSSDGRKGMDEISPSGRTIVAELHHNGEISSYELTPRDFEIEPVDERMLLPARDRLDEAIGFLRVIGGKDRSAREDVVSINAAAILYITGKAEDLKEGFRISRDIIRSSKALAKLGDWVKEQNADPRYGTERLRSLIVKTEN